MKKRERIILLFVLAAISLVACSRSSSPSNSSFYSSFSIVDIVDEHDHYLLQGSQAVSGMEAGTQEAFAQRHEEIVVPIDDQEIAPFMDAVKASNEAEINRSGAVIEERELGISDSAVDTFSFGYQQDGKDGSIHVWGVPGDTKTLLLIALLTEQRYSILSFLLGWDQIFNSFQ